MIKMKVSISGKDINNESFSIGPNETVTLDTKSEKNLISNGMAEPVKAVKKAAKK